MLIWPLKATLLLSLFLLFVSAVIGVKVVVIVIVVVVLHNFCITPLLQHQMIDICHLQP